ncbi:MAG TPA: replication protein [Candidatus Brocadiaceae bacterium]|nr:replication protein [Candidatus Brocadiaceae bacterium]
MADPQCENGYTKIANELLEAWARIRIPGEARQVLDAILRKTYGFGKKADAISLSQFVLATGILKPNVCASLKLLKDMNLIIQKDNDVANVYSINKDYTSWRPLSKKITVLSKKITIGENNQHNQGLEGDNLIIQKDNGQKNVIQKDNASLSKRIPTIDNSTKETYCPNSVELRTAELLLSLIRQRNSGFKQPDLQKWADHVSKMIRIDERSPEDLEKVLRWCQADSFWRNNILSTEKLRKQFDALYLKMNADSGEPTAGQTRFF